MEYFYGGVGVVCLLIAVSVCVRIKLGKQD